jgi:hypothetical protein
MKIANVLMECSGMSAKVGHIANIKVIAGPSRQLDRQG